MDTGWELALHLPLVGADWLWGVGPDLNLGPEDDPEPQEAALYPLTALANAGSGLALALDLKTPIVSRFIRQGDELVWSATLGASPLGPGPNQAVAGLEIWPLDPEWGFRRALSDLYARHPAVFARDYDQVGLWTLGTPERYRVTGPFFFHEHGNIFFSAQDSSARDYGEQIALDEAYGWKVFPYLHLGQISRVQLDALPAEAGQADAFLAQRPEIYSPQQEMKYASLGLEREDLGRAMLTSRTQDENGEPNCRLRSFICPGYDEQTNQLVKRWETIGKMVSFIINAEPSLVIDGLQGHGGLMLEWLENLLAEHPGLGGVYLDSINAWSQYPNFRREHFPFAGLTLASTPEGRVYIPNYWGHYRFLARARQLLAQHPGTLMFVNGYKTGIVNTGAFFLGLLPDVYGTESADSELHNYLTRAMAGRKLVLANRLRLADSEEVEQYVNACLSMGFIPSARPNYFAWEEWINADEQFAKRVPSTAGYVQDQEIWARVLTLVQGFGRAGWEPVTQAQAVAPGVRVERFTSAAAQYLTVYNLQDTQEEVTLNLAPDLKISGLPRDIYKQREIIGQAGREGGLTITIKGQREEGELSVLECEPCSFAILPETLPAAAEGGEYSLAVHAQADCAWTAVSKSEWITFAGAAAGLGAGELKLALAPNSGVQPRQGVVMVEDAELAVEQAGRSMGGCFVSGLQARRDIP